MIWVAEIGSAHGGDRSLAFELIRQAKMAGATIAKFQLGWTEEAQMKYAGNINPIRNIDDWAGQLKEWCDHFDIEFMASVWDEPGVEIVKSLGLKRVKLASQVFFDDSEETMQLVMAVDELGIETFQSGDNIWVVPEYPVYPSSFYTKNFGDGTWFGYSSHMHGIADALIAVARGAKYIEKHVTLNKADSSLRDNSFALDFGEFKQMVEIGNEIARLV